MPFRNESAPQATAGILADQPIRTSLTPQMFTRRKGRKFEIYVLESEFPHCALPLNYFDLAQERSYSGRSTLIVEVLRD